MKTNFYIQKEIISHLKSSARSAQGLLCSLGLVGTLLLFGTGNVWGTPVTQTYTLSANNNGDEVTTGEVSWNIGNSAIVASSSNMKLTGTITVTLPTGATLESVSLTKSNNWGGGATVTLYAGSTSLKVFSGQDSYTLTSNKTNGTYKFTKTGTSSKNAWVKTISVTYTPAAATKTCVLHDGAGGNSTTDKTVGSDMLPAGADVAGWEFQYWCTTSFADSDYGEQGTTYTGDGTETTPDQADLYAVYFNSCTFRYSTSPTSGYHIVNMGPAITGGAGDDYFTASVGGSQKYCTIAEGTTVTLTSHQGSGSTFTGWHVTKTGDPTTEVTVANATAETTTFTMPAYNIDITANFCSDLSTASAPTVSVSSAIYNTSTSKWDITVNWTAVPGATKYQLACRDDDTDPKTFPLSATNVGNVLTYNITGLTQDHAHTIAVRATNDCNSTYKDGGITYTPTCPALTATSVSYGTKTSTSIVVNWTAVSGAEKYTLVVQKRNSADDGWESTPAARFADLTVLTKTITGLTPNTKYRANVQAIRDCGSTKATAGEAFTTLAQYTVHFDGNGATGGSVPGDAVKDAGSSYSLPDVGTLTKTGYTFGGWLEGSTSGTLRASGYSHTVNADITFYAKWTIQSYDVTFNMHDHGSAVDKQTIEYNGLVTEPSPAPSDADWKFGGWYKEAGYSNLWNFATDRVTAATTLHAKWTAKTYTNYRTTCQACVAPDHVDISGRWDRFGGETISLTAAAYASEGTGSPIADGDITGWQWEKLVGSTWNPLSDGKDAGVTISGATTKNLQIANCGVGNSGKYRCVVSTGATCSTPSATKTDGTEGFGVKVYVLECYTGGTTVYSFTRTGDTQAGTCQINLAAGNHEFKFHADNDYYGNNGTINEDVSNWVCSTSQGNLTIAAGLGGTFTINMEYSTSGSSSVLGEPEISVTYPRKTIYLTPGVWNSGGAKFAIYYFRKVGETTYGHGWTDFITANDCGSSADIPQWNGVKMDVVRLKNTCISPNWSDKWAQTNDITVSSNDFVTITGWNESDYTYTTYSTPTYTISYAAGTGGSGTRESETKTCGVDFVLPNSAVFTRTGYKQTGWATEDGGAQAYDLGGSYATNAAQTFYPFWTVNSHTLTWEYDGGTPSGSYTPAGTVAFGTALTAPTVTKTGYQFNSWSPAVDATMPDKDVTYTATWTANTYSVRFNANGGNGSMSNQNFTYGVAQNLTSNSFTHATKSFGGWTTNSDGTGDLYTNGQSVSNLTSTQGAVIDLYAKWVDCDLYTVTLNVNGDIWKTVTQGSCDASIDLSGYQDVPSCGGGYTFVGWSETNSATPMLDAPTITTSYTPESNRTLYAVYSYSAEMGTLVTNISDLNDDSFEGYLIAALNSDYVMGGGTHSGNNRPGVACTKVGNKCIVTGYNPGVYYFTKKGSIWYICSYTDSHQLQYFRANSKSGQIAAWDEEDLADGDGEGGYKVSDALDIDQVDALLSQYWGFEWTISAINSTTGSATIYAENGSAEYKYLKYNSGSKIFSAYSTGQNAIALYEYASGTAYTTQPDMTVYTITKGAEDAAVGTYTVTPGVVCSGSSVSLSATPTGSNTFIGWESDKGGIFDNASSATTTFTPSAATTTITANFGLAIVLDKNNVDGGSADGSAYVRANATSLSGVSAPTRTGYTVEGYYAEAGCTQKVADKEGVLQANVSGYTDADGAWTKGTGATLYAKWTANPHTLTWNFDGGESSLAAGVGYTAGGTVNYGTAITYPTNVSMTKTGYTFTGWSSSPATMPDADLTITALWTQNNYTLTMAANPADKGANITSPRTGAGTVDNKHYGDAITVTVTKPEHYTFTGWSSSNGGTFANASDLSTTFTMPDNATTVTANFTEDTKYTVTWSDNGDASNTTQVYSGGTTTFPALEGCDMYVAAGWVLDDGTFTEETAVKPGTIYAAGATTPAVSDNVTYKAVYRHKYYTTDEFVLNTTTAGGYYLSVNPGTVRYSGAQSGSKLGTVTNKANAVPVYVEKEAEGQYSFKLVGITDEQYIVGNNGADFGWRATKTGDYKWTVAAGTQGKGDYHILNAGTNSTRGFIYNNGSGNYIGNYDGSNVTSGGSTYYDMNFVPGYYYKYSPTKACYVITITSNIWDAGEFETIDPSTKVLDGTMLTVKVACGKTISSWSFTSGTATLASGENPEYIGMEGDKEVYRFTIIPTSDVTLRVNFGNGAQRTISFLDGSTVLGQTKTAAITDKRDCDSYTLPAGYNTAGGDGGECTDWTFDGWTATNYTYGQMGAPEGIVAAGTSEDVHGDATWYAVYHKTFAAGAYFKLKYGDKYISDYSSNKFTTSETEAEGLMFGLENDYLYYIDKTTRGKVWVYYVNSTNQNVTTDTNKPTSNTYKTTFTENSGTYEIKCNGRYLEKNTSDNVVFYANTDASRRGTRPDAAGFTAYYPKTDCAIEYVTVTYDAGAGNSCTPASVTVESGSTFTLPMEADITYDKSDWTFVGWSAETVQGVVPGAPGELIAGGGSYSTFVDVTLHAVYSQTPPDGTFDNSKGGKYIIWGEDGDISYYAKSNGQTQGKLSNTLNCSEAAIFEFVETENAGEYKIHIVGEDKYFAGEGCGDSDTDFEFVAAGSAPVWTVAETATAGEWSITSSCGSRSFIFQNTGSKQFGHYASVNTTSDPETYKNVHIGQCDNYYTTNPNKTLFVTGDVLVTSTNGRMVMAKDQLTINASNIGSDAPVTITSNSSDVYFSTTREVNISKASKPTNSVTINADGEGNITNHVVYVHYMPSVVTDGIEEVLVTVASPEKTVEHTIKVRHLPANFTIAAKVGKNWYALTGNMNGAKTPAAIQIEVDESSWTAYAPDTCAYQLWPVKTTDASGDRYQAQGEKVRFSAVNNKTTANAGLWANNSVSQNTINNDAAITAIASDPAAQYEWKIAATEVGSTWKYTLQMEAGTNNNKLNIHRDANLVWGTYTDGQAVTSDIYLLPISKIAPFEFQVVEWYPTKVLIQTEAVLASPSVNIAGEAVASPVLTNKGGKLWEISGLTTLAANPTEMLKINYTQDEVTYSGIKSIPVIISRSTQNVTAEPFTTLTKEVYNYADLVVRDGAVLTMDGTEAENKFYDVTIYPTSKISVPEGKKLGVHSLTFFGGIDEIYNGSTYTVNKYGVPELSLKGQFGTKTVGTIDYVMRVDDSQMYSLTVPYDVNLADITYWDGTSMGTLGDKLWVSAYDGDARAKKDMSHTWVYEADFESKFGDAKLKAGVGYTISADLQPGVGSTSSIIRMPMKSNVAANATESDKTVAVTAHGIDSDVSDNNKGWNLVGNPYMVAISGAEADSKLVVGYLRETGTGPWEWVNDAIRYVTIPADNGQDYWQEKFSSATLKPFKNFFLQIGTSGDLSFALASRQSTPARYLEAQKREVEFEINLANGSHEDHTGLLIAEEYSPAYEINADLEKMENAMAVYTLTGGYKLAYNALSPDDASQPVPVGYVANVVGTYTFDLDETSDVSEVEHIWLTDYELSRVVDLIDDVYEFTTSNGRNESRFALSVELKDEQQTPTGILDAEANDGRALKFIYHDKMYIMRNGVIYDATGKKVK